MSRLIVKHRGRSRGLGRRTGGGVGLVCAGSCYEPRTESVGPAEVAATPLSGERAASRSATPCGGAVRQQCLAPRSRKPRIRKVARRRLFPNATLLSYRLGRWRGEHSCGSGAACAGSRR